MGRPEADPGGAVPLLPQDHDPRWLPDPIPASFYARGEAPPWAGWAGAARGLRLPSRKVLAIGAVALAGVLLIVSVARLADRGASPTALRVGQAPPSQGARPPGTPPQGLATPFAAAPTPTDTPTPTPTPRGTPTPSMTPLTILTPRLQARRGRSVTLTARTAPLTSCSISVGYSPAPQLPPATASAQGTVSWKWTVSDAVRPGIYQILVTCGTGSAGATITVT